MHAQEVEDRGLSGHRRKREQRVATGAGGGQAQQPVHAGRLERIVAVDAEEAEDHRDVQRELLCLRLGVAGTAVRLRCQVLDLGGRREHRRVRLEGVVAESEQPQIQANEPGQTEARSRQRAGGAPGEHEDNPGQGEQDDPSQPARRHVAAGDVRAPVAEPEEGDRHRQDGTPGEGDPGRPCGVRHERVEAEGGKAGKPRVDQERHVVDSTEA